jgi:hypothetical protein
MPHPIGRISISGNHAAGIQRKAAEAQRRKGRKRKLLFDQRSPFGDSGWQGQNPLCAFASLRLCVENLRTPQPSDGFVATLAPAFPALTYQSEPVQHWQF